MAQVIHTRKGKYHYLYNHTRVNGKVVSTYLCPCNSTGDKRVAQETEPITREKEVMNEYSKSLPIKESSMRTKNFSVCPACGSKSIKYVDTRSDRSGHGRKDTSLCRNCGWLAGFDSKELESRKTLAIKTTKDTEDIEKRKGVAQQRKIIVGKPATYNGKKEIDYHLDSFVDGEFTPFLMKYRIQKYPDEKDWSVYQITKGSTMEGYIDKEKYCGTDSLRECRRYCIEKLEKVSQSEKS